MSHKFDPKMFEDYDIRCIYKDTFSEEDAYLLGQIYAQVVLGPSRKINCSRA